MHTGIFIWWDDLTVEAQNRIRNEMEERQLGTPPEDFNWDCFSVSEIWIDED